MDRIDKQEYYLNIAREVSKRSTCIRRQYGAVIVNHDEVIATGYNGAPRGHDNCCDVGECYREKHQVPHGEQYEKCIAVHAEQNAIISAARRDMIGATLYLAGYDAQTGEELEAEPCLICQRMIANAGIEKVVTTKVLSPESRFNEYGLVRCVTCGVFPNVTSFMERDFSKNVKAECPRCHRAVSYELRLPDLGDTQKRVREVIKQWNEINGEKT